MGKEKQDGHPFTLLYDLSLLTFILKVGIDSSGQTSLLFIMKGNDRP